MSYPKNELKLSEIRSRTDTPEVIENHDEGSVINNPTETCTYAVTVSKKTTASDENEETFCSGQKSFISIHSTDQLCQEIDTVKPTTVEDCNVEILSLNEVFPSTSEESVDEDEFPIRKKKDRNKTSDRKPPIECAGKIIYVPTNSKSSTVSGRQKETIEGQALVYSDFDIPKSTMYVVGSNPGEPKMNYPDPPKKLSKAAKKLLRKIDKHKNDQKAQNNDKDFSKLAMRGILKDDRCWLECTGDSVQDTDVYNSPADLTQPFDFESQPPYAKHGSDKNVTFNTQVVIIHFTGDLCVGQSVESLSKEKDQQARNSELRKTFLAKYNELWPSQK